jgi:AraC family transcriptional regulator
VRHAPDSVCDINRIRCAISPDFATIENVLSYISRHIHEPLDREVLAEVAGFSVPHFHRVFTAQVGQSAVTYVRRLRMERAARKLRIGAVDITEVARAAGYETHAAFSKAFKQQFGLSPSEFRKLGCSATTQLMRNGVTK